MDQPEEEDCGDRVENVDHHSVRPMVRQQVRDDQERGGGPTHFFLLVGALFSLNFLIAGQQQRDSPSTGQARTRLGVDAASASRQSALQSRKKETNRKRKIATEFA